MTTSIPQMLTHYHPWMSELKANYILKNRINTWRDDGLKEEHLPHMLCKAIAVYCAMSQQEMEEMITRFMETN